MSGQGCDVAKIQDEDVLRKMWQETEDFGRKKEIRAHMYKIREARLREFYNSGEVSKDIQRTHSSPGLREKGMAATHHADSLMDHSFLSLKSKEIRDSESPTRDITYRIGDVNKGWTVRESNERSTDGKTHSTTRVASTSGKEKIQGGDLNYAAKNEQHASVYQDGDDKNFTRAVGTSSKSAIKQEARGGDENSQFYSTSSKTQSSSKFVSEHKSSSIPEPQTIVRTSYTSQVPEEIVRHTDQSQNVRNTTYTSNVPEEFKKHPSYVEGKTKVYTETKTLPDGSTVTTTRYETVGGKNTSQTSSSSTKRVSSSNEQKYSTSENVQRSTQSTDRRQLETYSHPEIEVQCVTSTNRKQRTDTADTRDHKVSQNIKQQQATEEKVDRSSRIDVHTSKTTDQRQVHKSEDLRSTTQQTVRKGDTVEICKISKLPDEIVVTRTDPVDQSTVKTTVVKTVENKHDESKRIANDFINVEKHHEQVVQKAPVRDAPETCKRPQEETPKLAAPVKETLETIKSPAKHEQPKRRFESPVKEAPIKRPQEESPKYEQPERRQPIKPAKSEMDTKTKPTEGQYSTTYRSEFTNKKISVEVSPTHDAFARSLRSVTPERDRPGKCSSPTRSFRTSTSSIRSTSTPERMRHPTRYSPERRGTSPRKSPDQTYHRRRQDETTRTTTEIDSSTLTRRPKKKPSSRGSSPTDTVSDFEYRTRQEIVTDLDDVVDVQRKTTVDRRPNNLDLTTTRKVKKITERSPTSPISDAVRRTSPSPRRSSLKTTRPSMSSPTKQSPSDFKPFIAKTEKVLRRTDTYEERCRQILGIAEKKKVERNISDIILTDRTRPKSPEKKSPTKEAPRKPALPDAARRPSPEKYSPSKEPTRQSPDKPKSPSKHTINESPSQVRRTPEKQPLESYPKRKSPTKDGPQLKEFPAQSRKTPTKQPLEPYPQRKSPVKEAPQVQEFPSQIRKTPMKEPQEPLPKRQSPVKEGPQINEFPAQIRKTPTKEPQEPHHQRKSPAKEAPQTGEFPAQVRKTPERQTHPAREIPKQPREPARKEPAERKPTGEVVVDDLVCITREDGVRTFTTQKEHEILSAIRKNTRLVEEPSAQRKLPKKPKTATGVTSEENIYVLDADEEDTTIQEIEDFTTREIEQIIRQQKTPIKPTVTADVTVKTVDEATKIVEEEHTTTRQIDEFPSQRKTPSKPTTGTNVRVTSRVETPKTIDVNEQRKVPTKPVTTEEITTTTQKIEDFSTQPKSPTKPHKESPSQKKTPTKLLTDTDVTTTTRVETTRSIDVDEKDAVYRPTRPSTTKDRVTEQTTTNTHRFEEYPTQKKVPTKNVTTQEIKETTNISDVHRGDITTKIIEEFPSQRKSPAKPTASVDVTVCTTEQTTRIQEDTTSQKIKEFPSQSKPTVKPKTTIEKPKEVKENIEQLTLQSKYPTKPSVTPDETKPNKVETKKIKEEIPTGVTKEYPAKTTVTDVTTRNRQTTSTTNVESTHRTTEDFQVTQTTTKPGKKKQPKKQRDRKIPALKDAEETSSNEEDENTDITETSVTQFLDECLDEHTTVTSVEKFLVAEKDVTQSTQKKDVVDIRNNRKVQPKQNVDVIKESPKTKPSKKDNKPKSISEIFIETEKVESTDRTRDEVFLNRTDDKVTISEVSDIRTTDLNRKQVPSKTKPQKPNVVEQRNVDDYPSKTATTPKKQPKTQKPLPKPDEIITPKKYMSSKQAKQPMMREPSQEEIIAHSIQYSYGAREPVDEPMMVEKKMFRVMDDEEEDIKTRVKDFIVHEQVDFEVKQSPERLSPVRRVPSGDKRKPTTVKKDLPRNTTTVAQKTVDVTKRKPEAIVKQTKVVPKTVVVTTCKVDLVDSRKVNGVPGKLSQVKPKIGAALAKVAGVPKKPTTPTPDRRVKPVDVRPTTKTCSVKTEQVNRKEVVIEIKSPKKVVEQPKKKLVSTTINLSTKPRVPGVETRKKSTVKEKTPKLRPLQNGHRYTDEEDDVAPTKKPLRPSPVKQDTTKTQRKCVTTKSIIINNAVADEREIIVNLQRSKSSREETPDRIWPITNEEDSGIPRYPDQIVEPDEPNLKKPQKLSDIPLTEGEDVNDFNRFTELIDAKITEVDRVHETDECLLTVNEKVNKFLHTTDQRPRKVGPAPKVERPQLVIDESLKSDECLLSVTDKVNKFITTAEKLKVVDAPERPKSPRCRNFEETVCENVDKKIHKFIESTEKLTTKREKSPPKKTKPETPVEGTFETPKNTKFPTGIQETKSVKSVESTPKSTRRPSQEDKAVLSSTTRLRSTESIKKARALFEKVDKTDVERKHLNSAKKTLNYDDELNSTKVVKDARRSMSPTDKNVPSYMRDVDRTVRPRSPHRETLLQQKHVDGTTPHYMAPLEKHLHHTTESSHEEKIARQPVDGAVPHYMAPLDRVPHEHTSLKDTQEKSTRHVEEVRQRFVEHTDEGLVPHYMAPLDRSLHEHSHPNETSPKSTRHVEEVRQRFVEQTDEGLVPHYMAPLDRAPHEHGPSKDTQPKSTRHVEEVRQRFVEQTDEGLVPHYMAPLDRVPHEHTLSKDTQQKSTRHVEEVRQRFVEQTEGTVPHYMAPLDRVPHEHTASKDTQSKSTRHIEEVRQRFVEQTDEELVPHYMAPLDRAPHEHGPSEDSQPKSTRHVEEVRQRFVEHTDEGLVPHYMAPLDRSLHEHSHPNETSPKSTRHVEEVRQRFVEQTDEGLVPHYMAPLDRAPHEHGPSKDTQPKSTRHVEEVRQRFVEQTDEGLVPHYMAPLDRVPHEHTPSKDTQQKSTRHVEEVRQRFVEHSEGPVPHYMAPLDRAPHDHTPLNDTQPKSTRHVEEVRQRFVEHSEGPVPHYMAPLDRAPHEHIPSNDTLPKTTHHVEEVRQRFVEPTDESVPHYMAPLDRAPHEHGPLKDTQPKSTRHVEEIRQRFVEQTEGTVPHYMAPLDRIPHEHTLSKDTQSKSTRHVEEVRQRFVEQTEAAVPHYMAPLDRAPYDHTSSKDTLPKTTRHTEEVRQRFVEQTNEPIPHYMVPLDRSHHEHTQSNSTRHIEERSRVTQEIVREKSPELSGPCSPDGEVPGYMKQLDRSLRTRSPHKESVTELEEISKGHVAHEETGKTTKFGVVLKRTDSGRIERRRSSTTVTVEVEGSKKELEIEEIYDLELLEKMLEKVVGYELRRRVRSQIRIVKKLISENKLQSVTTKKIKSKSPDKILKTQEVHSTYKTETRRCPSPGSKASPERIQVVKSKKPEFKVFTPDLKRTSAPQKKSPAEDKPDWVVQRNLKKVPEQVAPKKVTSATTVKQTQEVTTVRKTVKPEKQTDIITSSYGVGPTDENGSPLFGLRALRAQNKNETTKVQGTVMQSTFYSENGSEPIGEISLTQYSTDPKDLGSTENLECHGEVLAKTTTQKFGATRKAITDKKKIEDDKVRSTTTKVTRKGSVKEISQKFLDNAVETLKSEKQTSYPRAGLILRTSGFKEGSGSSREGSPIESEEVQRTVQVESSSTGSFLTNTSRVTGAQDVIDRMRVEEYREEDTLEDAEARNTLNKFLGSQVLLAGMESQMKMGMSSSRSAQASASTTTSGSLKQTTITTTITENGIPKTTTRTYTHPITPDVLETIWEEQTLRLLLEQSSEYEERRIVRARLKQVMAEKEACSEFVEKAIEESDSGNVQGESLLLPLLQGVLDAPEVEQTADSGTECGEDLRSGLIIEVQNALDKLSACLSSDSTDISPERRDSLLQLVTKLQTNLNIPSKDEVNLERRSSGQGRFSRRRQRPNRHTVGVTSEELEDARRLMEEIALRECINPLQKQNSEGSVQPKPTIFRPVKFQPHPPIKNAMAKPFGGSTNTSQSQSGTSSTVDTPTIDSLDLLYSEKPEDVAYFENATIQTNGVKSPSYNQSLSLDHDFGAHKRQLTQSMSLDFTPQIDPQSLQTIHAVHQAAILKTIKSEIAESETDEDSTIRNDKFEATNQLKEGDKVVLYDESVYAKKHYKPIEQESAVEPPPDLILQTNPVYANPVCFEQTDDKANKFNTKKIKMKRANTIDIPKPLNYYPIEDDDESDAEQEANKRRSNYLALRGPIRVGKSNNSNVVPAFEPKTESDKKFLAFINKHNETSGVASKVNLWDKTVATKHDTGVNWQKKFGNLKTNFEQGEEKKNVSSARSFWKSADDAVAAGTPSYHGPKISRQNAKNLQQMFEQKQRQGKLPEDRNVVTGSLKVDTKNLEPHKNYRFVPQPLPVNKFSHNPQSAFRPIQKTKPENLVIAKSAIKAAPGSDASTPDTPLYLYSPKNFELEQHSTPWSSTAKTGERRVLSLAASKFEQTPAEDAKVKPRKVPKVTIPPVLQTVEVKEKLPTYMAPQSQAGGSVRKLSGQYDNMGSKPLHQSAFAPVVPKHQQKLNGSVDQQHKAKPTEPKYEAYTKVVQNYHPNYESLTKMPQKPPEPPSYNNHYTPKAVLNHHPNPPSYASINHPTNADLPYHSNPPELPSLSHRPELRTNVVQGYHSNPAELPSYTISNQYSSEQPKFLNGADTLDIIPPSFHTTSPTVQNIQKTHSHPTNAHPEPHVYYNNVHTGDHQYTSYSQVTQRLARQPTPPPSPPPRPKYDSQVSQESLHEYTAISSKVMSGPVSQLAVTVQQNTPKNRNEHDMDAALNLKSVLQKIDKKSPSPREPVRPNFCVNDKPLNLESLEVNDRGETIVTSKFQIPMKSEKRPTQGQILSKCDSWHQICQDNQAAKKPSPRSSPNARSIVKSKSTHTLALPKQFEAGMSRDEMQHKKRTMEAYFGGSTSPQNVQKTKRSINRVKTTDKISISHQSTESVETTRKTFSEGPVTKTQVTRVTSQQITKKTMSPFAKFRQLDKQNSLNTPPSTPKTPTSGGPMFKFTDPNLSRSASTIKERLLQWCQMKTREYENIKLDNFSTSWADGLAFCALIHHFLPDAFDYHQLTPNNRRYNFTLAFQVADEKADIAPLLDVDDMVATRRPDWKCVFTYVQSIYRRFKDED